VAEDAEGAQNAGKGGRQHRNPGGERTPADASTAEPPSGKREFRMAELAAEAGVTTRTVRFYRERKLLPAPRREGRIAWYDEHHLARLRTIAGLLERGHTLGGIADLLDAFESGRDSRGTAELLGLEAALTTPFSEETPVRITPEELAGYFKGEVTPENLAASMDIGYVAVDGDEFIHVSRRLLDASSALVDKGVPLSAVLAAGRVLRSQTDVIAEVFAGLFRTHLLPTRQATTADGLSTEDVNELLTQVQPIAKQVVEAELGLALDRRVRSEIETWLGQDTGD
jgi:DNA-binding transcriptional MerR regulator